MITTEYLNRAELWMFISLMCYCLMNGAGIFETAALIPKWSSNVPESLKALQGKYAPNLKAFWIVAHSVHELTFILAIAFAWQAVFIRNLLLVLFCLHFFVRIWTLAYFAPRIMRFQTVDLTLPNASLIKQVRAWRRLNYIRTGAFIALSIMFAAVLVNLQHHKSAYSSAYKDFGSNYEQTMTTFVTKTAKLKTIP